MPPEKVEHARWFADEVQPHGAAFETYLRRSFPYVRDVEDVVQDSYLRIWRARAERQIRCARAFLFRVGRHLALDQMRRERISPVATVRDIGALPISADVPDAAAALERRDHVDLLSDALADLPSRCREIMILRKLHDVPQREVAARLGVSERTVEAQVARGVKRCEDYLRRRGINGLFAHE